MTKRLHWVDIGKGILIILLLVHHFVAEAPKVNINKNLFWFVFSWQVLYTSFFMQAFFFLSGYCSSFDIPFATFIKKLIKQLVIPFICFEILICLWDSYPWNSCVVVSIWNYWLQSNGTSLWFINALIFSKLVIWIINRIHKSDILLLAFSFILLFVAIYLKQNNIGGNFLCFRQSLAAVLFVSLGFILKEKEKLFEKLLRLGVLFPYILLLLPLFKIPIPQVTSRMDVGLLSIPVFIFVSTCGTFELIRVCKYIGNSKILEFFGKNTLIIYSLNHIVLISSLFLLNLLWNPLSLVESVLFIIVFYSFVLLIFTILIHLFRQKPLCWTLGRF